MNMRALMYSCILIVTAFHFTRSQSSYYGVQPCFPVPRHETCKETIENLKTMLEVTQSLKPDPCNACHCCARPLSEELIMKLVNALIYTATQNCGSSGKGHGDGSNGNAGGLVGGGNNVINNEGGVVNTGSSGFAENGNPGGLIGGGNSVINNEGGINGFNKGGKSVGGGNPGGLIGGGNSLLGGSNGKNADGLIKGSSSTNGAGNGIDKIVIINAIEGN